MKLRLAPLVLGLALSACAGNPAPGEPGYAYNVDGSYQAELIGDDGVVYAGTFQLATEPGGAITGTMEISDPIAISGVVEGLLVGAEAALSVSYEVVDQGCGGIVAGSGVIQEGGAGMDGLFDDVTDECGGAPTSITFVLSRAD